MQLPRKACSKKKVRGRPKRLAVWFFLIPALLPLLLFYLYPAFQTIFLSFFSWGLLSSHRHFVGLANYGQLLRSDRVLHAYGNAMVWVTLFPLGSVAVGLSLALLFRQVPKAFSFLQIGFLLPLVISYTAGGILWIYLYNPDFGLISLLRRFLPFSFFQKDWLSDPVGVNFALIVTAIWLWSGFAFLIFRAGLAGVSWELLEAAALDGAHPFQLFSHILLPLLKRPLIVVLGMSLLFALKVFDLVYAVTRGGPGVASEVPALLLFRQAFTFHQEGVAMANAVLLSLLALLLALLVGRGLSHYARQG